MFPKIVLLILTLSVFVQEYVAFNNFCYKPIKRGNGTDVEIRWAWVPEASTCTPFHYTGSGGNDNNFFTERECLSYCSYY